MSGDSGLDLVTGAFSYSGAEIARRLLDSGRRVRTLTFHPERPHPLRGRVEALPYWFDDPVALAGTFEGVSTFYNTYWVRFDRGMTTFETAIANSRALFHAAQSAGVGRIVHISIANPSIESPLPYFRGKALVERALAEVGVRYAIVRPTWIFGGERDVLTNNIAWILRRMPVFMLPGSGGYPVQPVHVSDLAQICVEVSAGERDATLDAAGPDTLRFDELVDVILTAGLLVSERLPLGSIAFRNWIAGAADSIGRTYANELERHFRLPAAAR